MLCFFDQKAQYVETTSARFDTIEVRGNTKRKKIIGTVANGTLVGVDRGLTSYSINDRPTENSALLYKLKIANGDRNEVVVSIDSICLLFGQLVGIAQDIVVLETMST